MSSFCTYCRAQDYTHEYRTFDIFNNNYELVKCNNCKAYFLSPNPNAEQLLKAYDDSYYGGSEDDEKFEGFVEKGLNYFRYKRAKQIAELTQNKGRVLDVGCGNGRFLELLSKIGKIEIFGTEMSGSSARRAARIKNINLKIGELEATTFSKEYFDVITLFHVFEHIQEPVKYLEIIDNILKKDAYLVMSFPNIDSWQAKLFKGRWLHLDPPRHLFFYKPKDLIVLMQKRGYVLIKETYFSVEQNPFGAIQSILNLFHKKRELLFESLKGNESYTKETSKLTLKLEKMLFVVLTPLFVSSDFIASFFKKSATVELVFKKKP